MTSSPPEEHLHRDTLGKMKSARSANSKIRKTQNSPSGCKSNAGRRPEPPIAAPTDLDDLTTSVIIVPMLIRPSEDFKKFASATNSQTCLHDRPAFLFISFVGFPSPKTTRTRWGPTHSSSYSNSLTGDVTVGLVWNIMAGATANYGDDRHGRIDPGELRRAVDHLVSRTRI